MATLPLPATLARWRWPARGPLGSGAAVLLEDRAIALERRIAALQEPSDTVPAGAEASASMPSGPTAMVE